MKKLLRISAVTLVCVLAIVLLVGCTPVPNTDYGQMRSNLIKNGYLFDDSDNEALSEESVKKILITIEGVSEKDIEKIIFACTQEGDAIGMVWLKTETAAEPYYKGVSENTEKAKEYFESEIKVCKRWIETLADGSTKNAFKKKLNVLEKLKNILCGKIGKVVYVGTPAAISATN
ncbi:MAG: hypothetical protein NC132_05415 [Corallococcus sp.]|nr:hypothetical protein [Corallococcus sp.]MCM1359976.1 hypothetical protein [Corallococcus sp.]MCM1395533.1 hypothetical protein [Corallococcus sp.]